MPSTAVASDVLRDYISAVQAPTSRDSRGTTSTTYMPVRSASDAARDAARSAAFAMPNVSSRVATTMNVPVPRDVANGFGLTVPTSATGATARQPSPAATSCPSTTCPVGATTTSELARIGSDDDWFNVQPARSSTQYRGQDLTGLSSQTQGRPNAPPLKAQVWRMIRDLDHTSSHGMLCHARQLLAQLHPELVSDGRQGSDIARMANEIQTLRQSTKYLQDSSARLARMRTKAEDDKTQAEESYERLYAKLLGRKGELAVSSARTEAALTELDAMSTKLAAAHMYNWKKHGGAMPGSDDAFDDNDSVRSDSTLGV